MKSLLRRHALVGLIALSISGSASAQQQYWDPTDATGTITDVNWGAAPAGPYTNAYVPLTEMVFGANTTLTYVTSTNVGNITVGGAFNVALVPTGTLTTNGAVRTLNVATGGILDFSTQNISTAAGTGIIKDGDGVFFSSNGNLYTGGFTLNAGTVVVGGVNALGGGAGNVLNINGGTIAANASRDLTGKYTGGINVGGNFTLGGVTTGVASGNAIATANLTFTDAMNLGASTRTINIGGTTTATVYNINGVISGGAGTGLTVTSSSAIGTTATLVLGGAAANTYTGLTTVSSGILRLSKSGGVVAIPGDLTINGGSVSFSGTGTQNQIANTSNVIVTAGLLNSTTGHNTSSASVNETIASLSISGTGGFSTATASPGWVVTNTMSMTGGSGARFTAGSGSNTAVGALSLTDMTAAPGGTVGAPNSFAVYGAAATQSLFTVGSGGITLNNSRLNMRRGGAGFSGSRLVVNGNITTAGTLPSFITEDTAGGTVGVTEIFLSDTAGAVTRDITAISNANLTIGIGIKNGASSAAGINKLGGGILELTASVAVPAANTYTGATLVSAGTLSLTGTGAINTTSGITISGSGAKFLQTSSVAVTPVITLTQGTLTGNTTVGTVNVGAGTGGIVSNNNGVPGAALTTGALTFAGAATVNTFSSTTAAPIVAGALSSDLAGVVTINPSAATWINGSTYNLISYTGGSIGGTGSFGQFALGTVTGLTARQVASPLANTGSAITTTISGDSPYWTGIGNGNWNTTEPNNWKLITANTATQFLATDDVLFNDNGPPSTTTIDINAANVAPNTVTFNNTTAVPYTLGSTGGFGISNGTLTKNNTGTVTITTANTYTGATTINGGILNANASAALGSGVASNTLVFGGGTLQAGGAITSPGTRPVTLNAGGGTIDTNGNAVSIAGVISGTGALTKSGAGTLTLTGTNLYNGNTTISAGTLSMASNLIGASPTIFIGNGATWNSTGSFTLTANQNVTGTGATGNVTVATFGTGIITTSGSTFSTTGTLTFTRLDVRGAGNVISTGAIVSGGAGAGQRGLLVGNGVASDLTINTGASLTTGASGTTSQDLIGNGSGNGTLIINGGTYTNTTGLATLLLGNGATNLGGGTLTVSTGSATIGTVGYQVGASQSGIVNLNGGTLTLGNITSTGIGSSREFNFDGGQFVASAALTLPVSITTNVKNGGAKIDTGNFAVSVPGALLNFGGSSTGGLTKTGTGTLTFSAVNTYTGVTDVQTGTLALTAGGTLGTGNVIVNGILDISGITPATSYTLGTAQVLSGDGTINATGKTLNVNGTLAPGNSPGSLDVTGDVVLAGTTNSNFEIGPSSNDLFAVTGSLTYAGALNINTTQTTGSFDLFNFGSLGVGDFSSITLSNAFTGSLTNGGGGIWTGTNGLVTATFTGSTGVLNFAVIPEPSTLVLGGLALLGFAGAGLRRRRLAMQKA